MTFSLRRKRRTTRPAPTVSAAKIVSKASTASTLLACLVVAGFGPASARGQGAGAPVPSQTPTVQQMQGQVQPLQTSITRSAQPLGQPFGQPSNDEMLQFPNRDRYGRNAAIGKAEDDNNFFPKLTLPDPDELFRRDSEAQLFERITLDARKRPGLGRVFFPQEPAVSDEPFKAREFPRMVELVEPAYVCHGRLLFEQPNFERYGYDFGILQPGLSTAIFWYDIATLPYHAFSRPAQNYDCSAGKCLPGDPVPLLLYREPFSLTGFVFQTGAIAGGFFAFP